VIGASLSLLPFADTWGMHGDDVGAGWMIVMMVAMVLFWGAIILGIVWLARGGFEGRRAGREVTPTEILDRRFAEGAISTEDYRERREFLETGTRRRPGAAGDDERATPGPNG
jgi:putative membrane protein